MSTALLESPITEETKKPKVLEQGTVAVELDVKVDDNIYCMQHEYELPHTTLDPNGNTVVSVVEKAEIISSPTSLIEQDCIQAKLYIKVFKNEQIKVEGVISTGQETHPHQMGFLKATIDAISYNKNPDVYLRQIRKELMSMYNTTDTSLSNTASPLSSLRYSAYTNTTDLTSSATVSVLKPYITKTTNTVTYNEWRYTNDCAFLDHVKYWNGGSCAKFVSALDRMKEILRDRQSPAAIIKSSELRATTDIREIRARQTLRRLIGDQSFQRYSVRGFITFRGIDRTYQIFPGHGKVKVWQQGKQIEELCVVLSGDFPPTDSVIMRLLLIQDSESRFKKIANVFPAYAPSLTREVQPIAPRSLPVIFAELKAKEQNSNYRLVA